MYDSLQLLPVHSIKNWGPCVDWGEIGREKELATLTKNVCGLWWCFEDRVEVLTL